MQISGCRNSRRLLSDELSPRISVPSRGRFLLAYFVFPVEQGCSIENGSVVTRQRFDNLVCKTASYGQLAASRVVYTADTVRPCRHGIRVALAQCAIALVALDFRLSCVSLNFRLDKRDEGGWFLPPQKKAEKKPPGGGFFSEELLACCYQLQGASPAAWRLDLKMTSGSSSPCQHFTAPDSSMA